MRSSRSEPRRGPWTPADVAEALLITAIVGVLAAAAGLRLPVGPDPDPRPIIGEARAAVDVEPRFWSAEPEETP